LASSFSKDVGTAVDCFRPLLKRLRVKEDIELNSDRTVYFMEIRELDFLNLDRWSIVLTREKVPDLCGRLIARHIEPQDLFQYHVFLNDHLFYDTPPANEKRRIVIAHEFTHIAANIYAYSEDPSLFLAASEKKLNEALDDIGNEEVSLMYRLLRNKGSAEAGEFGMLKTNKHSHYFVGPEKIGFSYTDLFLNLLFSKGAFEEYFNLQKQKEFHNLWRNGQQEKALDLYHKTAEEAAAGEWVSKPFARDQVDGWLKKYIQTPIY